MEPTKSLNLGNAKSLKLQMFNRLKKLFESEAKSEEPDIFKGNQLHEK